MNIAKHEPGTRGRAVVVDDQAEDRALIAYALRLAGFEVATLDDGLELLEVLRMAPPKYFRVVVTDQRLPGLHGTEVLARTGSRRTRFVILTGYDTPRVREDASRYGAAGFLRKPFDIGELVALLDDVVPEEPKAEGPSESAVASGSVDACASDERASAIEARAVALD